MSKGVIWEDIQVGKLYTPMINHATVGYYKLLSPGETYNIRANNMAFLFEAGEPILVISRYFDNELRQSWLRIIKDEQVAWIRYENSFIPFMSGD